MATDTDSGTAPLFFGQPRGVFLISTITGWERFSYWGMRGLLVLFLVSTPSAFGFGWTAPDTLRFIGTYTLIFYIAPGLGGWASDAWLGRRNALVTGSIILVVGHLLMAGPAIAPHLVRAVTGVDVSHFLFASAVPLAKPWGPETIRAAYLGAIAAGDTLNTVVAAYLLIAASFYLALSFIVVGGGLVIASGTALVGDHYPDGANTDAGYTLYYTLLSVGSLFSNLIAGTIGERLGWHYGFTAAGLGMLCGLLFYLSKERAWIRIVRMSREPMVEGAAGHAGAVRSSLPIFLFLALLIILFWSFYEQSSGFVMLFIYSSVDRAVFGWEVPATWFQSLSSIFMLALTPLALRFWAGLDKRGRNPAPHVKFALSFIFLGMAFAFYYGAALDHHASLDGKASMGWLVGGFLLLTVAEMLIIPTGFALVSRVAPARFAALILGLWFLNDGIASFVAGQIGAWGFTIGDVRLLGGATMLSTLAGIGLLLLSRRIGRFMPRETASRSRQPAPIEATT